MSLNINIDESPIRPNVRPPRPPSKRGTLTFIAEIVENNRPDIFRNLTRGVDETVEPSPTLPVTGTSVNVSLDTIPIYLELLSLGFKGVNTPLNLATVSSTLTVSADFASSDINLRKDLGNVFTTLTVSADFLAIANVRKDLGNVSTTLTANADFLAIANVRKDLGNIEMSLEDTVLGIEVGRDGVGIIELGLTVDDLTSNVNTDLGNVSSTLTVDADFLAIANVRKDLGNVFTTLTASADFLALANVRKDLGKLVVSLEASSLSLATDTSLGNVFTTLSASSIYLANQVALGNVSSTLTVSADFLATANQREALGLVEINLEASGLSLATDVGSLERVDTTLEANVLSLNTDLIFSLPNNMETPPDVDP